MKARHPVLFTTAYGAGLATGLLHFLDPLSVIGISGTLSLTARRPLVWLLSGAAIMGSLSASIAVRHESGACAVRLPAARLRLNVRLLDPVAQAGGRVEVQPVGAGCTGRIAGRWPPGRRGEPGSVLAVTGRWIPRQGRADRPSGTLVVSHSVAASLDEVSGQRIRRSLTETSRSLYGSRAPMVDALVLGRRGGIDRGLQDRFAQSGLVHLLSISGFHVGVITSWIFLLCRLLRVGRGRALWVAAGLSVAYVAFLGWPAPATRAAALAVLLALSRSRQRRVEANSLLSATCLCVLVLDPWALLDLGGWLSVAALWGASTFARWTDKALGTALWWRTLGSSVGATLATAPITAGILGTVSVVGILLNFAAIPLAALAVPGVFASLLVYPVWPDLAAAFAAGSGLGLHLLEILATYGAAIPGGHIIAPAEPQSAIPWFVTLAVGLWATGHRNTLSEAFRRWSWSGVVALWVAGLWHWIPDPANSGSGLALHFLDVGQGDGALLRTPAGRWVLIDAGPRSERSDAGRRVLVPFLLRQGVKELNVAFLSHAHADHLGGFRSVLDRFPARIVIEPGLQVPDSLYHGFLDELAADAVPWHAGRRDERFTLDSVSFTILHPDRQWGGWGEDVNEDSLVLLIEYGSFQVLFAGDAGFPAEREMQGRLRPVDLLKVGHHGSRGSTGEEWLDSLRPNAAVISVGRNTYGHPSPETLSRLRSRRVVVWRTDQEGPVAVLTDGQRMTIRSQDRVQTYDVR